MLRKPAGSWFHRELPVDGRSSCRTWWRREPGAGGGCERRCAVGPERDAAATGGNSRSDYGAFIIIHISCQSNAWSPPASHAPPASGSSTQSPPAWSAAGRPRSPVVRPAKVRPVTAGRQHVFGFQHVHHHALMSAGSWSRQAADRLRRTWTCWHSLRPWAPSAACRNQLPADIKARGVVALRAEPCCAGTSVAIPQLARSTTVLLCAYHVLRKRLAMYAAEALHGDRLRRTW